MLIVNRVDFGYKGKHVAFRAKDAGMDKTNVIDFTVYRSEPNTAQGNETTQTEDLGSAIRYLIQRLRESNPIEQAAS